MEADGHANACAFWRELPAPDIGKARERRNPKLEELFAAFDTLARSETAGTRGD